MLTLDRPSAGVTDYSISAESARVVHFQPAGGPSLEHSDRFTKRTSPCDERPARADEPIHAISLDSIALDKTMGSSACASAEGSDPRTEWALLFEQGLKRAAERIRTWSQEPASLADDGLEAPSQEAIARSFEIINKLNQQVMDRVAPDAATRLNLKGVAPGTDGEICFELGAGSIAITYRVEPNGTVTELLFVNSKLHHRKQIS